VSKLQPYPCPTCGEKSVRWYGHADRQGRKCRACGLVFQVRDGVVVPPAKERTPWGLGRDNPAEYQAWESMCWRCHGGPKASGWVYYGARGVSVCDRWRKSFRAFFEDMGPRPSGIHSLDRIDVNGNYEPGNCRWTTPDVQGRNRRSVRPITVNGITQIVREWAAASGLSVQRIRQRIAAGWTDEAAVLTPIGAVSSGSGRWKHDADVLDPNRKNRRTYARRQGTEPSTGNTRRS
jgi:hypothetical protein